MERQGRIAELISLLDYAISIGNDDLAQEVRSDIFRETKGTLQMNEGGMMNIDEMIRPIGMAAGGPIPPEDSVLEKLKKNDPDKELRDKGILPPLREKEGGTLLSSGMHPLVVFKEMYDQYRIDGGEMSFKEFFDMIQIELNKEASS
jgi:hypothetical protein